MGRQAPQDEPCRGTCVGENAMKITLVTDAWTPQVNGVVRTLSTTVERLRARGHEIQTVTTDLIRTAACPGYSEIRLALMPYKRLSRLIDDFKPGFVSQKSVVEGKGVSE